jgi:hypothetical protein
MMPTIRRTSLGLLAAVCFCSVLLRAEDAPKQGLDNAKEELGNFIQLEIRDGRLSLVRKDWGKETSVTKDHVTEKSVEAQLLFLGLIAKVSPAEAKHNQKTQYALVDKVARSEDESDYAIAEMEYDAGHDRFRLKLSEKAGAKRTLLIDDNDPDAGLLLQIDQSPLDSYTRIQQCADDTLILLSRKGNDRVRLIGDNLDALLKFEPGRVQVLFLRAFTDLGVRLAPYKFLPTAMASATSGFGAAAPEHAKKAEELIAKLSSEKAEDRDAATTDLIRHFPLAVKHIKDAAEKTADPEVKARLAKVIAAHPGIAKILPWVKEQKLHEDRAYLIDLLENVPFFKASARARLTEVCGKDFGDDPAEWRKP